MPAVTRVLKALSNLNRRKVYQIICRRAGRRRDGGVTIDRICGLAGMKQPAVSHHVTLLAEAGLIVRRKSGWYVRCTPVPGGLAALARFVRDPARYPLG